MAGVANSEKTRENVKHSRVSGEAELWIWVFEGNASVSDLEFSPNGRLLASAGSGEVWLWDVETGKSIALLKHPQHISSIGFSPDGEWLLTGCWDNKVRIWNVEKETPHLVLTGHEGNVNAVAFHPKGRFNGVHHD